MSLGFSEWLVIGVTLLVVFSASRMSALGNALGKFVYSFKRAAGGKDLVDVTPRRKGGKPPPGTRGDDEATVMDDERPR